MNKTIKTISLFTALMFGVCANADTVAPLYCNHNDVIGSTPIVTNVVDWVTNSFSSSEFATKVATTNWVHNLLKDKRYNLEDTNDVKTLLTDLVEVFGGKTTRGLEFQLIDVPQGGTVQVSGLKFFNPITVEWGDGSTETIPEPTSSTHTTNFWHTYENPGFYIFKIVDGDIALASGADNVGFIKFNDNSCCVNHTELDKNYNLTAYGDYMLANSKITEVTIPNRVHDIGIACFAGCTFLTSAVVNASLERNPLNANQSYALFRVCPNLKTVKIGADVGYIPTRCFEGDINLETVDIDTNNVKMTEIRNNSFNLCGNIKELYIPESVTNLSLGVCGITNITLPRNLERLSEFWPGNYATLKEFDFPTNNLKMIGGIGGWSSLEHIELASTLEYINDGAFYQCSNMTNVVFIQGCPSLIQVGKQAFYQCAALTNLAINAKTVGDEAFKMCSKIKTLQLTNVSLSSVGYGLCDGCSELTSIKITATTPPTFLYSASSYSIFGTIPDASLCKIYIPSGTLSAYQSANGWSAYQDRFVEY